MKHCKHWILSLALVALVPACIIVVSDDGIDSWHDGDHTTSPLRTEVRTVAEFHALEVSGSTEATVRVGEAQSVVVTAPEHLLPFLKTEVREGKLVIERASGAPSSRRRVQVTVTVPALDVAALLGSGDITVTNAQGSAFKVILAGSGDVRVSGTAEAVEVELDGSGDVELYGLVAKKATVRLAGSGDVRIAPTETLDIAINGSGDVRYRGSPRVTQAVRGSGDVHRD